MNAVVMLDPAVGSLIVGCFALLFVVAAGHKLRDLQQFAQVFAAYGIAPLLGRRRLAWLVPLLEIGVALGLLLPQSRRAAALAAAALLLSYAIAIRINLRAGRVAIACGCGGPDQRRPIAGWMVWRTVLLALVLGLAALPWSARALEWTDGATIGFGLAAIALLYACAERLLGELGRAPGAGIGGTA
jgi:uncharacterized membrane protein YphA (DoxX/SURF4 family)